VGRELAERDIFVVDAARMPERHQTVESAVLFCNQTAGQLILGNSASAPYALENTPQGLSLPGGPEDFHKHAYSNKNAKLLKR